MIQAILAAIAAVPKLFELVEKAIFFLSDQINQYKKKSTSASMDAAIEKAGKEKDTSDIEAIFNPGKKKK